MMSLKCVHFKKNKRSHLIWWTKLSTSGLFAIFRDTIIWFKYWNNVSCISIVSAALIRRVAGDQFQLYELIYFTCIPIVLHSDLFLADLHFWSTGVLKSTSDVNCDFIQSITTKHNLLFYPAQLQKRHETLFFFFFFFFSVPNRRNLNVHDETISCLLNVVFTKKNPTSKY